MSIDPTPPSRRPSIGLIMLASAMVAANAALVAELLKLGSGRGPWAVAFILGINAVCCVVFGAVVRYRPISLIAMFTTAALTETLLIQASRQGGDTGWITAVAMYGCIILAVVWTGHRRRQRRRAGR